MPIQPILANSTYSGRLVTCAGIIIVARMTMKNASRPRHLIRDTA